MVGVSVGARCRFVVAVPAKQGGDVVVVCAPAEPGRFCPFFAPVQSSVFGGGAGGGAELTQAVLRMKQDFNFLDV